MRRIPIYSYISTASLQIRSKDRSIAIDKTEYVLYLEKFFSNSDDLSSIKREIEKEIVLLLSSYKKIAKKPFSLDEKSLFCFDSYVKREKEESFSVLSSLERIIEFYARFLILVDGLEEESLTLLIA